MERGEETGGLLSEIGRGEKTNETTSEEGVSLGAITMP